MANAYFCLISVFTDICFFVDPSVFAYILSLLTPVSFLTSISSLTLLSVLTSISFLTPVSLLTSISLLTLLCVFQAHEDEKSLCHSDWSGDISLDQPSYGSVFCQIREANAEADGSFEFVRKTGEIVANTSMYKLHDFVYT